MLRLISLAAGLALSSSAFALSLADLSQSDASGGLKDALTQQTKVYDTRDVDMQIPHFTDAPQIGFKFGEVR